MNIHPKVIFQDRLESAQAFFLSSSFAIRDTGSGSVQERFENKLVKKFYAFKKNRKQANICEQENVQIPWVMDGNGTSAANEPCNINWFRNRRKR